MNLIELAQRIRDARLRRGLTLDEVADASGLAKGLLSKVENFRVTPTLPTLAKLTAALGVNLSDLLDGLDRQPAISVVRRGERKEVQRNRVEPDPEGKWNNHYAALAHKRAGKAMEPFEIRVPAGGGRRVAMRHEGEEFLVVLEGRVAFQFGDETYRLEKGDSIYFDAETDHRVFNEGVRDARVLSVMCFHPPGRRL